MLKRRSIGWSLSGLFVALLQAACGGGGETAATGGMTGTGGAAPMVDRGPTAVTLEADPNGLFWDAATATLYIADNDHNRILQWTDAAGVALVADLPGGAQNSNGLGQVVKAKDGTIAVTVFGFGDSGAVEFINPDKTTGTVPNLDITKRRVGLTVADDGTATTSTSRTSPARSRSAPSRGSSPTTRRTSGSSRPSTIRSAR